MSYRAFSIDGRVVLPQVKSQSNDLATAEAHQGVLKW